MNAPGLRQALLEWVRIFMRRSMREFVGWINRSDLSSSQIGALMRIYHRGECPISDIGEDLGITPAAASQMVDRLVQLGLLGREVDLKDRRVKQAALTPQGRKLIRQGVQARLQWLGELEASIPVEDHPGIIQSLRQLTQAAVQLEGADLEAENALQQG